MTTQDTNSSSTLFDNSSQMPELSALTVFKWASAHLGCQEAALKLIFSLVIGYPICIVYNLVLTKQPLIIKHLYFITCGMLMGFFNYGINFLHTTLTLVTVYLFLTLFRNKFISVLLTFTFCTTYLLWGYWRTQSDEYTFEWTIPQCVLTLRLIAVAFDVYDGHRMASAEKRNVDASGGGDANQPRKQEDTIKNDEAMFKPPTFIQLAAHSYFPASFMVGPQFGIKRYLNFVNVTDSFISISLTPALQKLIMGLIYLAVFQVGSQWAPPKYLISPEFETQGGFWSKFTTIAITCKIQLCKYISIWLISEGCCVASGVTYDKSNNSFDTCTNVNVFEFETTPNFAGCIRSFNVSTNQWAAKYIFKRLRFVGSKFVSHTCTLFYLALWHGWRSGYYVTFTMEFLIMKMEHEIVALVASKRKKFKSLDRYMSAFYVRWPLVIFFRIYTIYMFGYCLVPFVLLTASRWLPVLQQIYFIGHVIYVPWQFSAPFLKYLY